ncbi:MAG: hypothetical protein ABI748_11865 [Dokdonella sp.]
MNLKRAAVLPLLLLACLCVSMTACKQQAPAQSAAKAVIAPSKSAVSIARIDLGTSVGADLTVGKSIATFVPADTIYAAVTTAGIAPSAKLDVRWLFEDGSVLKQSSQTLTPTGPTITDFNIANPEGWPAGRYKFEVSIDGVPAGVIEYRVTP